VVIILMMATLSLSGKWLVIIVVRVFCEGRLYHVDRNKVYFSVKV
jgi:hypothetical protein